MAEQRRIVMAALGVVLAVTAGVAIFLVFGPGGKGNADAGRVPAFAVEVGKVREPLEYRIVSFHRGRADKELIKLAKQLGFNGVQFQIEGSNEGGIAEFAERDKREGLVAYCHSLGMKVTVWVREMSDLAPEWMPEYLGPVETWNEALWRKLDARYEWVLTKAIPQVDGLVLTVVETQENATSTPIMLKVVDLVSGKCKKYGKEFVVRTFVWHPDELAEVMAGVDRLPKDMVVMSKIVPQDWQMRGGLAAEVGAVGGRPQIIEFDVAGEYFLKGNAANCMVELLKRQFDAAAAKGAKGICVRVDRDDFNVLFQPQEVNLWALGMLASGATDDVEEVWRKWGAYRYPDRAVEGVVRALKPTEAVVAELLSMGPFTHGDTRAFPPLPTDEILGLNWQMWRWDKGYEAAYQKAATGDAGFIEEVGRQKEAAKALADRCLQELEGVRADLPPVEYAILRTRLVGNRVQLEYRSAMVIFTLKYWGLGNVTGRERETLKRQCREELAKIRAVGELLKGQEVVETEHLGRKWVVGGVPGVRREALYKWCWEAEGLLSYY